VGFPGHIVRLRLDLCGNTYYTQPSQQPVKWVPQLEMRTNPERPLPGEEFQVLGRIPNLPTYSFGVQTYVRYETSRDGGATWVNLGSGFSAFPSRDWQVLRTDRMDVDGFMVRLSMTLAGTTYSTPPSQQPLPFEPQIQIWSLPDVPVANQALTLFVRLANRPTFGLGSVIHRIEQSDDRGQTWTALGWTSADAVPPNPPGEYSIAPEQAVPGRWFRATMPRYSFGNFEGTSAVVEIPELCPADFDGSGFADADDFVFYLAQFSLGCDGVGTPEGACAKSADFDRSGFVDSDDFVGYLAAFQAGCP
jgi:hypothetical protein